MLILCLVLNLSFLCSKRLHQGSLMVWRLSLCNCSGYKLLIATDMCCDWNSFSFAETLRWALPASPESPEKNGRKHHWFWDFERKQTHSVYSMFYTTITVMRSGQANIWRHHQLHLDLGGITSKLAASNLQTGCFWHFHAFSTIIHQHDFPSYLIKTIIYSAIAVTLWQNLWQNARYCVFNPSNSWQLGCVFSKVDNKKQNETTKENQPEKCVRSEPHHSRTPLSGTLQFQRLETHRAADHQAFRGNLLASIYSSWWALGKAKCPKSMAASHSGNASRLGFCCFCHRVISITQTMKVRKIYIMNHDGIKKNMNW